MVTRQSGVDRQSPRDNSVWEVLPLPQYRPMIGSIQCLLSHILPWEMKRSDLLCSVALGDRSSRCGCADEVIE